MASNATNHLELEVAAAFVDGALGRKEAGEVVRHLASCEECSHMIAETMRYGEERGAPVGGRTARTRGVVVLAGSIAASLLIVFSIWMLRGGKGPEGPVLRGVGPLMSALSDHRSVDARLSGGFPWAPLEPFERSGAGTRTTPSWELLSAATAIRKEADAKPTPENLHALGVAHLVLGDLDDAVSVLRRVAREPGAGAKASSDLAAALLERGERKGRADDLMEALSAVEEALRRDPALEEALFNRAVALEKLHLDERAAAAWRDYLARAPEGGWSDEARRRLERLEAPKETGAWEEDRRRIERAIAAGDRGEVQDVVARRTQETRLLVENDLLGAWAEAAAAGRGADAEAALSTAEALAEALLAAVGDPTTRDSVAQVRSVPPAARPATIRGLLAYREGVARYAAFDIDGAYERFDEAREALSSIGAPSAHAATYALARCVYFRAAKDRGAHDRARSLAEEVLRASEAAGHRARAAHARWLMGLVDLVDGRLGESLSAYQRALDGFRGLREEGHAAFLSSLLGEAKGLVGDEPESLRLTLDGVGGVRRVLPSQAVVIYTVCAMGASRNGYADAALELQGAAVERARKDGDAADMTDALLRRAAIALDAGRPSIAEKDIEEFRTWSTRVADPNARLRLEAEGGYVEARFERSRGKPLEAVAALGDTISFYRSTGMTTRLPLFYAERARAFEGAGDVASARRDLEAGVEIFEKNRLGLAQDRDRVAYFDGARDLFDRLVALEIEKGRAESALSVLERGKTRDLLDQGSAAAEPLPHGLTVVEYGVLQDRLLVWAMSRDTRELTQQSVAADDLASLVGDFREGLERRGAAGALDSGSRLREILVDPVASRIRADDTIVFVPDQILNAVPFAALPGQSGGFLVEDHAIVVAPSLSLFRKAALRAASERAAPRTLLAVGDPAFDTAAFPNLPRLSRAASEVEQISRLYLDSIVLTGEEATRARFLAGIEGRAVIHVAAHALGSDTDPDLSRLMLAPDPERRDSGVLFAADLRGRSFDSVQLVVLAACATASGRLSRSEGPLSLARPFLAGGVPSVVATLWEIEDVSSAELLVRFHRGIASGRRPDEALREAQIAMIRSSDEALRDPRVWAAFEVVGGTAGAAPAGKEG